MIESSIIQEAADRIWNAALSKKTCVPVRELIGDTDLESAYEVQRINTRRKLETGQQVIGFKIGLTSEAVQSQLGVNQPDFGILTDRMIVDEKNQISMSELMQPKAEAEIAFVLSRGISSEINLNDLKNCIEYAIASIEIVGSRIEGWNIRITDTIADNASASHFALGKKRVLIDRLDLENAKMNLKRNGEIVSSGTGKACLGNPLNAALWLANTMVKFETPLKAGDIILAGALGPMVPVAFGDCFRAEIEGLGEVNLSFSQ